MNRPEISREKLENFIQRAFALSKEVRSKDGFSMSPSLHDEELARRVNKVCAFLREAHEDRIINLDMMACAKHAKNGVEVHKHTRMDKAKETYIAPKGKGYSKEPFQPNIKIFSARQFFGDAVNHVSNMAKAIKGEADKTQTSRRITHPYEQISNEWTPAKLAA